MGSKQPQQWRRVISVAMVHLLLAAVNAKLTAKGLLLKSGIVVDATLVNAPSSTKNISGERDPETHQTKKGNQ